MLANGNGVSSESGKGKKGMLTLSLPLSDNILVEAYGDWNSVDGENDVYTLQGFAAYQTDNSRIGLQVARQIHQAPGADSETMSLISAFAVLKLKEKCNAFARIDKMLDPNPGGHKIAYIPFDNTARSTFAVAGLDHSPAKNVHLIPNIEAVFYEENVAGNKPGMDLIPRLTVYYKF